MFLELREIEIKEVWYNKNSEEVVVVDNVFLDRGVVQVDYTYIEGVNDSKYCTADLDYFIKEYVKTTNFFNKD